MPINKIKRLASNVGFLAALQLLNILAPFILLPFLTRTLDIKEFGAVMTAMSAVVVAYMVTDYGFSLSSTYRISRRREDRKYINNLISVIFTAKLVLCVIATLLFLALTLIPSYSNYRNIFLMGVLAVWAQAYQPVWLFQGLEELKSYAGYVALTKIFHVVFTYCMVDKSGDGYLVLVSWSISNFLGLVIGLYFLKRLNYRIGFSSFKGSWKELKRTSGFFISKISVILYTSGSSIIVGIVGLQQAAIYTSAEQGYKAGQAFTSSISQSLYPYMAKEKNWKVFYVVVFSGVIALSIGGFAVAYNSNFFITLIFGEAYLEASPVLRVMVVTLLINFLGVCFGYSALSALSNIKFANSSVLIGSSFFLTCLLFLFLTSSINAMNVALVVMFTELVVFVIRAAYVIWVKMSLR